MSDTERTNDRTDGRTDRGDPAEVVGTITRTHVWPDRKEVPTLATTGMHEFTQRPIHWLWDQRLALGKLAIVAGDPGLGKSFLTLDLAARVSRDGIMPDGFQGPCGNVLLISAEDDPSDTLLPRLRAANAVLDRIRFVRGVHVPAVRSVSGMGGSCRPVFFERLVAPARVAGFGLNEIGPLRGTMESLRPRLLVIDPITAYLGETDSNNNAQVRAILAPLAQLAADFECCVLAVSHLNKSPDGAGKAMYRTMGSLAFVAAARSAWLVTIDKRDPQQRIFAQIKNNLGKSRKAISFRVSDDPATSEGRVEWDPTEIDLTADDAVDDRREPGRPADARDAASGFLREQLAAFSKTRAAVLAEGATQGLSVSTLDRAAKALGVLKTPNIDKQGNTLWTIPRVEADEENPA